MSRYQIGYFVINNSHDQLEILYKHHFKKFYGIFVYVCVLIPAIFFIAFGGLKFLFTEDVVETHEYIFPYIVSVIGVVLGVMYTYISINYFLILLNWRLKVKGKRLYYRNKYRLWEPVFGYDTILMRGIYTESRYGVEFHCQIVLSLGNDKKKILLMSPAYDPKKAEELAETYKKVCQLLATRLGVKYQDNGGYERETKENRIKESVY